MNVIFYGAGKYVEENWDRFQSENMIPDCFADQSPTKQNTKYFDRPVYSLEKAIAVYPDYIIYITMAYHKLTEATIYLLGENIPKERIKYLEDVEWRKSCGLKEQHISFEYNIVSCCLQHQSAHDVKRGESIGEDLRRQENYFVDLITRQRETSKVVCETCRCAYYGVFRKKPEYWRYGIRSDFYGERCNMDCKYCNQEAMVDCISKIKNKDDNIYTLLQNLKPYFRDDMVLGYAAAEITLSDYCEQILDFIINEAWKTQLSSNASVYNEKIAHLMKIGQIELIVSIDAGTRETFKKVRGVNLFDKVIHNLERYRDETGGKATLQYIIIDGINDGDEDINGFVELVKRLNGNFICTFDATDLLTHELSDRKIASMQKIIDGVKGYTEIKYGNAYNQIMRRPGILNMDN
jgi:pyruvate-formate lyase-activating enzyme